MFGDRIQQSTTSTGAVLTLGAASTNMRAFSDGFSTAGQNVQYAMRMADGSEWEDGFGRLTGANQITRDYATANSSGTAPTILTFSAGTKYVTCTPVGRGLLATMPPVIAGSDPKIVSNQFCISDSTGTSAAPVDGRVYYLPLQIEQACRIETIGFWNTTHGGNYAVDAGIYNVITDSAAANPGLPGALLHNATGITVTGVGWQSMAFSSTITLAPGPYFMAIVFTAPASSSTILTPQALTHPCWLGIDSSTVTLRRYLASHETAAALPATANTTQTRVHQTGGTVPYVALGAE